MESIRPTIMEIDIEAFKYNVKQIQNYIGDERKIMPVIKANAYGTYINKEIELLESFDIVAVALVNEAVELRKLGYDKEIFVLNQPYKDEIEKIIKYNVTVGVSALNFVEELGKYNECVNIHIEIGTGMGRTGIHPSRIIEFIDDVKKYKNINIEGIYTHLSSADYDDDYTKKQLTSFNLAVDKAMEYIGKLKYIHCSASNGILNYISNDTGKLELDTRSNLVRPGIILYGYESFDKAMEKINLKPVCKLKSKVTFLKEVDSGVSIGYSRSYVTNRKTKVATIPIGYADGLKRNMSNKGEVVINNKKVPIIGKVCMDSFMADVTDLEEVSLGDDVYIWDNKIITLEDVASNCDTINYEIMSTISDRVPRIFN